MRNGKVAIIDYGINNISSFVKAFNKIKVKTEVINHCDRLSSYQHIVLPGVGSFDFGVQNLIKQGLFDEIKNLSKKGHYILGVCLGMQLLFEDSEENVTSQVELDKSCIAAPSLWDHEIVEHVSTAQHKEFNEEWHVEDLFLLWSTEKDKVICVDKSQYGQAQPERNQFTCRKLK